MREAGTRALDDAGLSYDAVEQAYAGYRYDCFSANELHHLRSA